MLGLSPAHLILIALVVLLLFGGGRVSGLMGDVAKGIKSFKKGLQDDEDEKAPPPKPAQRIEQGGKTIDQPVQTPSEQKHEG